MKTLTGKQKRTLRGLGHHLKALVQVGQRGIHAAVIEKVDEELENHELVKIKIGQDCLDDTKAAANALAEATESAVVQTIGRTLILYRARLKDPEIKLS
jgi:RNA-binding protein